MTAFTITTAQNIDALASKAGGDTYAINGGTLTIDQDSRYGTNQSTSSSLGRFDISPTRGGSVEIDARTVRIIPYNTGSGNVPASNTVISQGAITGKLIGVWSAINAAPTVAGSAMPASGWIKVKQVVGSYAAGALTGLGATATGADVAGWIELVGDESTPIVIPRLGSLRFRGEWFAIGSTTGTATSTYQLPTSGSIQYFAGVWVETTAAGVYEFFPRAGSFSGAGAVATDDRGKVCWITTAGVLTLGYTGTNTIGFLPPPGRKIRIPNIICQNCTTAARNVNAIPNATLGSRFNFSTTVGGAVSIDKAMLSWYPGFANASSVALSNVGVMDQVYVANIGTAMTWDQVGVGLTSTINQAALNMSGCGNGGTISNCVFPRYNGDAIAIVDSSGFTFEDVKAFVFTRSAGMAIAITRLTESAFTRLTAGVGMVYLASQNDHLVFKDTLYFDTLVGSSNTSSQFKIFQILNKNTRVTIDGLSFIGANSQPNRAIMEVAGSANENFVFQNIGSAASPLDMGTTNPCNFGFVISDAYTKNFKFRRIYLKNLSGRTFAFGGSTNIGTTVESVRGDYADTSGVIAGRNTKIKGLAANPDLSAQNVTYGTHFSDFFNSATSGRIVLMMNEASAQTQSYVTLVSNAAFTGTGGIYMPVVGMSATFEMDYFALGHTGFSGTTPVMEGGSAANYNYRYQLDKNNGSGWGAWSANLTTLAALSAALSAETLDAALGVKLKLEISTVNTNTSAITSISIYTTSTTTTQAYQYPLDAATLALTGIPLGTEIHAYLGTNPDTAVEIAGVESATSETFSFQHTVGGSAGYITFIKRGLKPFKLPLTYATEDVSIPVFIGADLGYNNPA